MLVSGSRNLVVFSKEKSFEVLHVLIRVMLKTKKKTRRTMKMKMSSMKGLLLEGQRMLKMFLCGQCQVL